MTTTDGYRYDNGGRLTYVKRGGVESNLSYDARGNILFAEGNSYTYSGDRVSTFTPFGQSAVYFTHDSRGRMTYDGASGVTIDYNYLNLTRKISGTGGTLAKYSYLANGSKTEAENGSGEGLVYRGSLIYKKASGGTLTFDGASIPEGRLLSGATRLYVTDHLGSVKAVVNGNNGNLYEVNNYTVYGKRSANSSASSYLSTAPTGEKFRQHFTGKEDQAPDFAVPFTDFGARQYSPALRRWLVPDPLSEKYYGISPYAYCAGDPVNLADPDGRNPIAGALLGAGFDIGIQIATNIIKGEKWYKIDVNSVVISAGAGALGAGLVSKVKQAKNLIALGKTAVAASEIMTEAVVSGAESAAKQYVSEESFSIEQMAKDAVISAVSSGAGQVFKAFKRVSPRGHNELKTLERRLNHAERVAGNNPRPSRQSEVEKARAEMENVGNKEKEIAKGVTTVMLTVLENLEDEEVNN